MAKRRWKDANKSLWIYISPEKEEELKKVQTENDEKREQILKLIKTINQGNKEAVSKKKSEVIKFIDEFTQQYQSLYALYDSFTSEVRRVVDVDSSGSSDSEPYYSPYNSSDRNSPMKRSFQTSTSKLKNEIDQESEEAYLKNKLASTESVSPSSDPKEQGKIIESPIFEGKDDSRLFKEKLVESEEKIQSMTDAHEVYQKETEAQIKELEGQVFILKLELENMETEKTQLEEQLKCNESEAKQVPDDNRQLQNQSAVANEDKPAAQASDLQSEVDSLGSQTVSSTTAEGLQILMEDKGLDLQVKDSESKKRLFEEQIKIMMNEAHQSREAKEKFHEKIVELEKSSKQREHELSTRLKTSEASRNAMSKEMISLTSQVKSLQEELKSLQVEKSELCLQIEKSQRDSKNLMTLKNQNSKLTAKVEDQQKTLLERQAIMDKINEKQCEGKYVDTKSIALIFERKIEEAAQDLRKQFEDNLRILSRRVRVSEQMHVENKEWYLKTKEKYEQDVKDLKLYLCKLKEFSLSANEMLNALDTTVLKFEKCNDHFMNRISKVSCEVIFAKDWVMRKNKVIAQVKDDLDNVLKHMDDKESEILGLREKVWKLETKVREVENLVKQKEDGMLSLGEEKREAIRQLCVWIDYHRSHSDHLKKMINGITDRSKKTP